MDSRFEPLEKFEPRGLGACIPLAGVSGESKAQHVYVTPRSFLQPVALPPKSIIHQLRQIENESKLINLPPPQVAQEMKRIVQADHERQAFARIKKPLDFIPDPPAPVISLAPVAANAETDSKSKPPLQKTRSVVTNQMKRELQFPRRIIADSEATLRAAKSRATRHVNAAVQSPSYKALFPHNTHAHNSPEDASPESDGPQESPRPFSAPNSSVAFKPRPWRQQPVQAGVWAPAGSILESVRRNLGQMPLTPAPNPKAHSPLSVMATHVEPLASPAARHGGLSPSPSPSGFLRNAFEEEDSPTPGPSSLGRVPKTPGLVLVRNPNASNLASASGAKAKSKGGRKSVRPDGLENEPSAASVVPTPGLSGFKLRTAASVPPPSAPRTANKRATPQAKTDARKTKATKVRFNSEPPKVISKEPYVAHGYGKGHVHKGPSYQRPAKFWGELESPTEVLKKAQEGAQRAAELRRKAGDTISKFALSWEKSRLEMAHKLDVQLEKIHP